MNACMFDCRLPFVSFMFFAHYALTSCKLFEILYFARHQHLLLERSATYLKFNASPSLLPAPASLIPQLRLKRLPLPLKPTSPLTPLTKIPNTAGSPRTLNPQTSTLRTNWTNTQENAVALGPSKYQLEAGWLSRIEWSFGWPNM